ncbi:MAG: hypothetical protein ACOCXQ_04725 [Patescibacteria group bacterium]
MNEEYFGHKPENTLTAPESAEKAFDMLSYQLTEDICNFNCLAALCYLEKHHKSLFPKMALLKGHDKKGKEFRKSWPFHFYDILQDKDGTYYAFSPSNKRPKGNISYSGIEFENINPLTTYISGNNMTKIIEQIERADGGTWPRQAI